VQFAYEAVAAHAENADHDDLSNLAEDLTHFLPGVPGHLPERLSL
jgi:hypothetical protein